MCKICIHRNLARTKAQCGTQPLSENNTTPMVSAACVPEGSSGSRDVKPREGRLLDFMRFSYVRPLTGSPELKGHGPHMNTVKGPEGA